MDISYRLNNSEIEKLRKYKKPKYYFKKRKYFKK